MATAPFGVGGYACCEQGMLVRKSASSETAHNHTKAGEISH